MWATLILWPAAAVTAAATYVESEARVFYELSSASYCNGKGLAGWDCKPCLASKLSANNVSVYANEDDNMHAFTALLPADALGSVEDDTPIIAVAFKGTQMSSLKNWIENLKIVRSDRQMTCDGCAVHSGFVELWDSIATPLVANVKALLAAHPNARVVLTGHSMGGAVAMVAAYVLQRDLHLPISGPVYTFGSPRVGNSEFAKQFDRPSAVTPPPPEVWRLTHYRDPVPHLPMEIMGFVHIGHEVYYDEDWQEHTVCAGYREDSKCADSKWLWDSVGDHLKYFAEEVGVCN